MVDRFQVMRRESNEARIHVGSYTIGIRVYENTSEDDRPRTRQFMQWEGDQNAEPTEPQPAWPQAIEKLPTFEIQSEGENCSICLMEFKKNEMAKTMPCLHIFHKSCILTWLKENNTCPFCRYKLPPAQN